ncbi:MAG TPA: hypothetical protein VIW24_27780 [Aldersonia sp.]
MNPGFLAAYLSVTPDDITALVRGGAETTTVEMAAAITRIGFRPAPGRVYTPSLGAWRRMRALNAMGYSDERIDRMLAEERGRPLVTAVASTMPKAVMIPTALWQAVERVYDRCAMDLGPDAEVRARSRAEGMVPPLGWDDDDIDDPRARRQDKVKAKAGVDPVAVLRRMHGDPVPLRRAEIRAIVAKALADGWEIARLSLVLGITADSAIHALSKLRREIRAREAEAENATPAPCHETGDVEDTPAVGAAAGVDRGSPIDAGVPDDSADLPRVRCGGSRVTSETESVSEPKDSSSRLENDDVCARTVRRSSRSVVPAGGCSRAGARVRRSRSGLLPRGSSFECFTPEHRALRATRGTVPTQVGDEFEVDRDLEFIATAAEAPGQPPIGIEEIGQPQPPRGRAAAAEHRSCRAEAEYLALCAGNELATECIERPSDSVQVDGSCTAYVAFDALCVAAADASTARQWLHRAVNEWNRRRHHTTPM